MVQNSTLDKYKKPTDPLYNGSLVYFIMIFRPGSFLYKVRVQRFIDNFIAYFRFVVGWFASITLYNSLDCLSATTEHISPSNRVSVY